MTTEWSASHTTTAARQPAAWELKGKCSLGQGVSQAAEIETFLMAEEEAVEQMQTGTCTRTGALAEAENGELGLKSRRPWGAREEKLQVLVTAVKPKVGTEAETPTITKG